MRGFFLFGLLACCTISAEARMLSPAHKAQGNLFFPNIKEADLRAQAMSERALMAPAYEAAQSFASCATRVGFKPGALIEQPIGDPAQLDGWRRAVRQLRGRIRSSGMVAPVLLRAAFAEEQLKKDRHSRLAPLGLPEMIEGFPLRSAATCQQQAAGPLLDRMLATAPGSKAEDLAARAIIDATADHCGFARLEPLSPTVARIAWIDAAVARPVMIPAQ